ncbi:MAG: hypothetical protein QGI45_09300 [Myxococcota bacterium]|nr:hypothetical protein [Myxococcota bacterium]
MSKTVYALALLFLGAGVLRYGLTPIAGYDFWWHLKLGEQTWLAKEILRTDIFSTGAANAAWAYQDLGSAIFFNGVYQLFGVAGLVILKALVFSLTIGALAYLCLKIYKAPASLTCLLLALAIPSMEFRFTERPQIFSLLIPALVLIIIEKHRQKHCSIYWVIPLTLILANCHRGVLILPPLLFLYWLSTHPKINHATTKPSTDALLAFLGTSLASFSTPFGFASIAGTINLTTTSSFRTHLSEWAPTNLDSMMGASPLSIVFLLLTLIGFLLATKTHHVWQAGLAVLGLLILSRGIRMAPLLPLFTIPLIASTLGAYKHVWQGRMQHLICISAACMALVIALSAPLSRPALGLEENRYPQQSVAFIRALQAPNHLQGNPLNEYHYGGYMIFHLWPHHKPYIDGRADTIYDADFFNLYAQVLRDPGILKEQAQKHQLEWLFLEYNPSLTHRAHLDKNDDWTLIHWDTHGLIYVRTDGPNQKLAQTRTYHALQPYRLVQQLEEKNIERSAVEKDIAHLKRDDPNNPIIEIIESTLL